MAAVVDSLRDRQRDQTKRSLLQRHPLLAPCPPWVIRRVASIADEVAFAPGDVLAGQGRSPEWFFLIRSGAAAVTRDGQPLEVIGPGDHYGEVPLLARGSHPVTVRAITPVRAWAIGSQRFVPLVEDVRLLGDVLRASLARQPELVAAARAERERRLHPPSSVAGAWLTGPRFGAVRRRVRRALPPPARRPRPRWVAAAVALALAAGVGAAAVYHPPLAVIRPGPVIDVSHDVSIPGAPMHPIHGRYLLLTVHAARPSLLGLAAVVVRGDETIERVVDSGPGTAARVGRQRRAEFVRSQQDAVAAAVAALRIPNRPPISVRFRSRDVVGPSAGLVYALAIDDLLSGADHARGRVIAATGEITPSGDVGPVAYVHEKAVGARRAGAQVLLAPTSSAYEGRDAGVPVVGVSSIQEALARLAAAEERR